MNTQQSTTVGEIEQLVLKVVAAGLVIGVLVAVAGTDAYWLAYGIVLVGLVYTGMETTTGQAVGSLTSWIQTHL